MENNYIIHNGVKYISASEYESLLKECEELRTKSEIDPLTKLYRRGAAIERVNHFLKGGVKSCAFVVFDLDNFKHINDTFGHAYGNGILKSVAKIILEEIGEYGIAARFGGDEFFAFLPGCDVDRAMNIARSVTKKISTFDGEVHSDENLGCSAGVSIGEGDITYRELFIMADKALYSAKHSGKAQAKLYNHDSMKGIEAETITYTGTSEEEKKPYGDVISRAIEMASRAGTTEDAIYALFSHLAINFGINSATILTVDITVDMITVNYGYKLSSEPRSDARLKNNVGYYLHRDLMTFKELLRDRATLHIPQKELEKLSPKLLREVCDDKVNINHRLFYAHMNDNGNYSISSFIVPGELRDWNEDELRAISEISSIIMVYADKARYVSKHEEDLQQRIDTDKLTGALSVSKFYEMSGLVRKLAVENNLNCYLISTKLKNLREFNRTYSMIEGDMTIKEYYKSLDELGYRSVGITTHDSGKFISVIRTKEDIKSVKKKAMESALRFIDEYEKKYPKCRLRIDIGMVEVHQNDVLAAKLDDAYYDRVPLQ